MSKSGKMPPVNDAAGMERWHNERGIPWGTTYDGPDPLVVRRMVPAGTQRLSLSVHLANEHSINSDKALRGSEVEHMWAHLVAAFRPGQEHYHGDVPEPGPGKGDVSKSDELLAQARDGGTWFACKAYAELDDLLAKGAVPLPAAWQPDKAAPDKAGQHLSHCYQGENEGWCKYGDSDCPAKPASIPLEWHDGEHGWDTHDGYPRHQHSINGCLTISPKSTRLHFKGSTFEDEAEL